MWWFESLRSGFSSSLPALPFDIFRIALALAALWKIAIEHRRGAFHDFDPHSWVYRLYRTRHGERVVGRTFYRCFYILRAIAALALLAGFAPRVAAIVLGVWFLFQRSYDEKSHTVYIGLSALFGALGGGFGTTLTWRTLSTAITSGIGPALHADARMSVGSWAPFLIVMLTCQLYWGSAYRKLRAPDFLAGRVMQQFSEHLALISGDVRRREVFYPRPFVNRVALAGPERAQRLWRPLALLTVAAEILLPLGLLVPRLWFVAACLGVVMHAGFTFLMPVRLVPFSLAVIATYILFAPPGTFGLGYA